MRWPPRIPKAVAAVLWHEKSPVHWTPVVSFLFVVYNLLTIDKRPVVASLCYNILCIIAYSVFRDYTEYRFLPYSPRDPDPYTIGEVPDQVRILDATGPLPYLPIIPLGCDVIVWETVIGTPTYRDYSRTCPSGPLESALFLRWSEDATAADSDAIF